MSCRCGDIRDCERDLHTLRLAHGDAERLGIRLRPSAGARVVGRTAGPIPWKPGCATG